MSGVTPWPHAESSIPTPCGNCWRCGGQMYLYLVHHCTTSVNIGALRDLSPFGGGPNPWGTSHA